MPNQGQDRLEPNGGKLTKAVDVDAEQSDDGDASDDNHTREIDDDAVDLPPRSKCIRFA